MSINIQQIKELRDTTGVSMTACKKALEESDGDIDKAIDLLRKKGESKAAERAERNTENGIVFVKNDGNNYAMLKLACETDFVARGDEFKAVAEAIADKLLSGEISENDTELEDVKNAVLKLGENIQLKEMVKVSGDVVGAYVHSNDSMAAIVVLEGGSEDLAKDIAMHAAATNPKVLTPDEVSQELLDKEKTIWVEQLKAEGKPEAIMDKIMMGKEKKFREENALIKQSFVKNPELTIEQLLNDASAKIVAFYRSAI